MSNEIIKKTNSEVSLTEEQATEVVKKKRKGNNPQLNFGQEYVQPGDNARYLRHALATYNLPPIDIADAKQVDDRIFWYFNHCVDSDMKPTVQGLCNAIGISRDTLNKWCNAGTRALTHTDLIKKAYILLQELYEDYMLNGKINPVAGIFIGKNHFGYQDKTEVVLTPNKPLGEEKTPEEIIKSLPED